VLNYSDTIFEKITIRDYQAVCQYSKWIKGDSNTILEPFRYVKWFIQWTLSQFVGLTIKMNLHLLWDSSWIFVNAVQEEDDDEEFVLPTTQKTKVPRKNFNEEEEKWHSKNKIPVYEPRYTACEKEHDLYILRQEVFTIYIYCQNNNVLPPMCGLFYKEYLTI